MVRSLEIVVVIQNFSNNADTRSSTYYTSSNNRFKKCVRVLVGWNCNF